MLLRLLQSLWQALDLFGHYKQRTLWTHQADEQLRRKHLRSLPQTSPLFALPPEIRNQIYHLVFHPKNVPGYRDLKVLEVDLLTSRPPNHNLLQTCQQIYAEALQLFQTMKSDFWQSQFVIMALDDTIQSVLNMSDKDLSKIQNLTVRGRHPYRMCSPWGHAHVLSEFRLTPEQRAWTAPFVTRSRSLVVVIEVVGPDYRHGVVYTITNDGNSHDPGKCLKDGPRCR